MTNSLIVYDLVAVSAAFFLALLLRFDLNFSEIPAYYLEPWKQFAPFYAVYCIIVFWALRLYRSIWRFASYKELERVSIATIITCVVHIVLITIVAHRMPMSYYIVGTLLQFVFIVGICDYAWYPAKIRTKEKWFKEYTGTVDISFVERNTQPWNKIVKHELMERLDVGRQFDTCLGDNIFFGPAFAKKSACSS